MISRQNIINGLDLLVKFIILLAVLYLVVIGIEVMQYRRDRLKNAHDLALIQPVPLPNEASETEQRTIENANAVLAQANAVLNRANESADMADSILSFLEGASVLVGLALGAAAIFGYQNARELRQDIKDERKKTEDLLELITPHLQDINGLSSNLEAFEQERKAFEQAKESLQTDFIDLLQANQELSLKNYHEAHRYAHRVLDRSPENIQALYIAGWLETQYIPDSLSLACEHLEKAIGLDSEANSVKAAYGVALRRRALKAGGDERIRLFRKSVRTLEDALDENETLLDLNRESFWGPVGGNYRDLGNLKAAIDSYEKARDVTPGSSYPVGNLGALYLQQAKEESNPNFLEKALEMFALTINLSTEEMGFNPNDYFVMMDLAMAYTMRGIVDSKNFIDAQRWFDAAISPSVGATPGMLNVSLGGWRRLQQGCPEVWAEVQKELDARIEEMNRVIQEREQQQNS